MAFNVENYIATVQTEALFRSIRQMAVELDAARVERRPADFRGVKSPGRVVSRAIRMLEDIPEASLQDANDLVKDIIQHQYGNGPKPAFDKVDEKRPR